MATYLAGAIALVIMGSLPNGSPTTVLVLGYLIRMAAMGSSCATWVMTPELYPTRVRATAHSSLNCLARIGALLSPFLVVSSLNTLTVALILGLCNMVAVVAAWSLPETAGQALDKSIELSDVKNKPIANPLNLTTNIETESPSRSL